MVPHRLVLVFRLVPLSLRVDSLLLEQPHLEVLARLQEPLHLVVVDHHLAVVNELQHLLEEDGVNVQLEIRTRIVATFSFILIK